MKKFLFSLLFFPLLSFGAIIDSVKLQYAGEIGFLSAGITKDITRWYHVSFLYGYVPQNISVKSVQTIALKQDFDIFRFEALNRQNTFYLGLNIYKAIDDRYDARKKVEHPSVSDNYYAKAQQPFLIYWGYKLKNPRKKSSVFFEAGINENWLPHYFKKEKPINANNYVSLALGLNYHF